MRKDVSRVATREGSCQLEKLGTQDLGYLHLGQVRIGSPGKSVKTPIKQKRQDISDRWDGARGTYLCR